MRKFGYLVTGAKLDNVRVDTDCQYEPTSSNEVGRKDDSKTSFTQSC